MRFTHLIIGLLALAVPLSAAAQNNVPASVSLGTFRDRSGLDKPVQGVAALDINGAPAAGTQDGSAVASATLSATGVLLAADTTGYRGLAFTITGTSPVGTITIECSNDNSNYQPCLAMNVANGSYSSATASFNTPFYAPAVSKWMRLRVNVYTSGSFTAIAFLRQTALDPGTVTATIATQYRSIAFNDLNNGALAASTPLNGAARDVGAAVASNMVWSMFSCFQTSPVASAGATLAIQGSPDNVTWTNVANPTDASAAGAITLRTPIFYRYNRCVFVNGATAQTGLYLAAQFAQ
jgi:hypothetical protein